MQLENVIKFHGRVNNARFDMAIHYREYDIQYIEESLPH